MASWQVPHLSMSSRPDFNNDLGADSNSGPVLGPSVYLSLTQIMAPPWATPILCQMKYIHLFRSPVYDFLVVTISGQGPMPDFNNGRGNDLNSSCSLDPPRLFETDVNNDPPQAIPNPVSDGEYICSGLLLMVFWWVPYLSEGHMSDVNNGPGGD